LGSTQSIARTGEKQHCNYVTENPSGLCTSNIGGCTSPESPHPVDPVLFIAATYVNGWSSRRAAALKMMRSLKIFCCERAQQDFVTSTQGSLLPFAAYVTIGSDTEETGHSQL